MAKILVVDDDKDIIEIAMFSLGQDGHDVVTATNGKQGLERAMADRPDLIVLDIMMPEMDGLTVTTRLNADPATKSIPIIVLTAKGKMRETFISAPNVKSFMDKPFEPSALLDEIRTILRAKSSKPA